MQPSAVIENAPVETAINQEQINTLPIETAEQPEYTMPVPMASITTDYPANVEEPSEGSYSRVIQPLNNDLSIPSSDEIATEMAEEIAGTSVDTPDQYQASEISAHSYLGDSESNSAGNISPINSATQEEDLSMVDIFDQDSLNTNNQIGETQMPDMPMPPMPPQIPVPEYSTLPPMTDTPLAPAAVLSSNDIVSTLPQSTASDDPSQFVIPPQQ